MCIRLTANIITHIYVIQSDCICHYKHMFLILTVCHYKHLPKSDSLCHYKLICLILTVHVITNICLSLTAYFITNAYVLQSDSIPVCHYRLMSGSLTSYILSNTYSADRLYNNKHIFTRLTGYVITNVCASV